MKNIYMFQPQYAVEIRKEDTYWLPYSVGCLWSYCSQFKDITDNFELKEFIFRREDPQDILDRLDNPAVCAFSCYIWNDRYNLHVAKLIKEKYPDCIIEFGGPQGTKHLLEYDFIDTIIISEGEESFCDLLRKIKERIEVLDFPSPFQSCLFDDIIQNNPDVMWAMTMETNRGCPHMCTYCDWGGMTYQKIKKFDLERVKQDIEWAGDHNVGFIFNADANFGIFRDRDVEIAKLFRAAADKGKLEAMDPTPKTPIDKIDAQIIVKRILEDRELLTDYVTEYYTNLAEQNFNNNLKPEVAMNFDYKLTFKEAHAAARKRFGADKNFVYRDVIYSTNTKEEKEKDEDEFAK